MLIFKFPGNAWQLVLSPRILKADKKDLSPEGMKQLVQKVGAYYLPFILPFYPCEVFFYNKYYIQRIGFRDEREQTRLYHVYFFK